MRTSNTTAQGRVDFDTSSLSGEEESSGFDLATDTFLPPSSGLYWLHFSVGMGDEPVEVHINGLASGKTPNVIRTGSGMYRTALFQFFFT